MYGSWRTSVDGTDFRIYEPQPFDPKWYSHGFKGPGLRYEVGICITTGFILWLHGPFPCGSYPDLKIFHMALKPSLTEGERVVADGTYKDGLCVYFDRDEDRMENRFCAEVRARHEKLNRRLKQFYVLEHRFRHSLKKHSSCFFAVVNITQLMIENGETLFTLKTHRKKYPVP